ncbi:hypothetical protein RRG08_026983 [Elysia crispata]|uniref:Reverse transcriptase n=1 Tax=Elysia crispata TaxID=231223 RepID=A0AAE1DSU7_9GAST|nr:hypothetical protein RRG08_026983 [Elysia crispata]
MVGAVTTRAQARQEVSHKPLTVPDTPKHTGVDRRELIRLQQDDEAIKRMGETAMSENRAGRTSFSEERDGIVYRVYNDETRRGIRDDLNVPSCVAVVEDYDYEADKRHDQDNLTGDEQASEDLPEIGTWGQKEDAADVKFGEALTNGRNRELQLMVQRFSEIFSDRPGDTNLAEHQIDLTFDVPVHQTPYPVPFALKSSLKKGLQQMQDVWIIRKSDSPYASPVVVVKKDESNRICIDFRSLNKIAVTDPLLVPSPAKFFLGMSEDK